MYLLLDTDNTYSVVDSPTSPTITSCWWPSPFIAVQKYFDAPRAATSMSYCPEAEVIAHFTDIKSYDKFCILYPEYLI